MELIKTADGSLTAYSKIYDEHYHSLSGAWEEAQKKHVEAIGIGDGYRILDFCFGLGYNSIAAMVGHKDLQITGLEIDKEIVAAIGSLTEPACYSAYFNLLAELPVTNRLKDNNNNEINIIWGDAAFTVQKLPDNYFHAVFFDPFSPQKLPALWTEEIFAGIYAKMRRHGRLSTYTCSKRIRKIMRSVGFEVSDGPIVGRKNPATIAVKG